MNTLPPETPNVNGTIEEALQFADDMATRGVYSKAAARNYQVALRQLTEVLAPDEARDLVSILANITEIGRRFAIKHGAKPTTLRTYVTRASTLIQGRLDYQRDPLGFKGNSRPISGEGKPKSRAKTTDKVVESEQTVTAPASSARTWPFAYPTAGGTVSINLPLGDNGRMAITKDEWHRIAVAVMAMAADFDPNGGGTRSGAGSPPSFLPPAP